MKKLQKRLSLVLLISMLINLVTVVPGRAGFLQNIGDFLSLGANTVRELQTAIEMAGGETRATLEKLSTEIQSIIQLLSEKYQDNLEITVSSVDELTRRKLIEFEQLLVKVNQILQDDIRLVSSEAQNVIRTATQEAGILATQITESLKDVIIVAGNTAVYVVDRATYNLVLIISVILLGVGLLVFAWMLFTKKFPQNVFAKICSIVFIFLYIGIFLCFTFIPVTRVYAVNAMGGHVKELEQTPKSPHVFSVQPEEIVIGETKEVKIRGINLRIEGSAPRVFLGQIELPVKAYDDTTIMVDVSRLVAGVNRAYLKYSSDDTGKTAIPNLLFYRDEKGVKNYVGRFADSSVAGTTRTLTISNSGESRSTIVPRSLRLAFNPLERINPQILQKIKEVNVGSWNVTEGSYSLAVNYGEKTVDTRVVTIRIPPPPKKPADLTITGMSISPPNPKENDNISVNLTIKNIGESDSGSFLVEWKPSPYSQGKTQQINNLSPGAYQNITFTHKYQTRNMYKTIATADVMNQVNEINEENNTFTMDVQVTVPRYSVRVEIYKIYIKDDKDGALRGAGDLSFNIDINGIKYRYPSSGNVSINTGETKDIWYVANLLLTPDDTLRIIMTGKEDDDVRTEDMGLIDVSHSFLQNFGNGDHEANSTPYNYKIYYRIKVNRL